MRNRRLLYRPLVFIAIVFSAISCSDKFFEEQAGDRITPDQHYNSLIDANVSLNGVLAPLQDVLPNVILIDGLRSDQIEPTGNADMYLRAIYNQNISAGNPYLDASGFYRSIINANEVLLHLQEIADSDPQFDTLQYKATVGALIGHRSWCYFNLAKLYGSVVWIPDNMAKLPQQEIVLQREALLDTLIAQLRPILHTTKKYAEIRTPRYINSKALLGEIYLEQTNTTYNNFDSAAYYLKLGCEAYGNAVGMLKVDKTFRELQWKNIFIGAENNTSETIGVLPFAGTEGQPNPLAQYMRITDQYLVKPSQVVVDSFRTQAGKGEPVDFHRGIKGSYDTIPGGTPYICKYSLDASDFYGSDIILSRASDLHLLLAEALNRCSPGFLTTINITDGSAAALILLNAGFNNEKVKPAAFAKWSNNLGIRGRAYLNSKTVPATVTDPLAIKDLVEDYIIQERALELAFEGHRWTDLMRVARRRGEAYLADRIAAKYTDAALAESVRTKLMDQTNWYLPLQK
ncbi:MAG: RagB/SusD family nutrient uptake outer membrane protein [Bacteroidales bacterium]